MVNQTPKANRQDTDGGRPSQGRRLLRAVRRTLWVSLLILTGALLLLVTTFLIPQTREAILGWSVRFADDALPGELTVGETGWPSLGHLILRDVLWVSGSAAAPGDTLADLAEVEIAVDLGALRQKDGRVESLNLDLRRIDVPRIVAEFEDLGEPAPVDSLSLDTEAQEFPYLQPGSLPGIPSVAVDRFEIKGGRIQLAPGTSIRNLDAAGMAEAGSGRPATVVIDYAAALFLTTVADTAGARVWEFELNHFGLGLTLEFPGGDDWTLATAALDSLNLKIAPVENPDTQGSWQVGGPVGMDAKALVERKGSEYSGHLDCDFVLPGSARFHPWLPRDFPHEKVGSVVGNLGLTGSFSDPVARGELHLDLGSNTWLEHGVIAGNASIDIDAYREKGIQEITAHLDTLDIALDGVNVEASGNWGRDDVNLDLILGLTDLHLLGLFAPQVDPALQEVWRDPGPVNLDAVARINKRGAEYSGSLDCDFLLPGSSHFHVWLPDEFPHEEYESLTGTLGFSGSYLDPVSRAVLRLDLGANPWMERGLVAGSAAGDIDSLLVHGLRDLTARIDTLDVAMTGVRLNASGELEPGVLELDLHGVVTDLELLGLMTGPDLAGAELDLLVDAAVSGSLEDPEVDAHLAGGFIYEGISVPTFDFRLEGDRGNVAANLEAGGGLLFEGTEMDSVRASVSGKMAGLDSLAADFALAAWLEDHHVALGGAVFGDTVRVVSIDSLVLTSFGREMRTRKPVTLTLGPGPETFELTELEFTGDTGTVAASGFWNEEGMDLEASVDLLLSEDLLQLLAPAPLWSANGGADLKLNATAGLEGTDSHPEVVGRARAFLVPHRDDPTFGVVLDFTSQGGDDAVLKADLSLTSADTVLLDAKLVWPGKPGLQSGFWNPDPAQDMVLTVPRQKIELERINRRLPNEMVLDGEFEIAAEVNVFPPDKQNAPVDSLALIPVRGTVDASLSTPYLRIDLPNQSWLETVVNVSATGPLADPTLAARVEITSGFIRIPKLPRNLHPVEGVSMIWALNDSLRRKSVGTVSDSLTVGVTTADTDSLMVFQVVEQAGPLLEETLPPSLPELDLEVVLTRDLRIMGYGADVKLIGGFKVVRGFDKDKMPGPSLSGDIRVREGSLKVMNRVFTVERGNIQFTGVVPPNPNLGLMLETQVGTYLLRVLISGKAANPVIELTSEPDLSEEDIMAVLLFGEPLNDLDNDQRGRVDEENDPSRELQKNLASLAMAFGAKGLQGTVGGSLGVDMVQMGLDSDGGSTLMVGKFITQDIMLKYHQSLEKSGTYFMTLEYSLNRYFKIVSTYGQGEEASGAELQWSKRY